MGFRPDRVVISGTDGCSNEFSGNGQSNIRVTQDCSLRAQAGEALAINPFDQANMLTAQNDSRLGFDHCGYDWTTTRRALGRPDAALLPVPASRRPHG